ncbi:hypothetical protein [uncultured Thiothrix sp.]|uniref:hypothetical protein n=1 Tax=uncultured Thiothrix sp. TaxID=223185 RepID=UPI00260A2C43|nr:hypothetical protein [uncultured Thiothrix sp.]
MSFIRERWPQLALALAFFLGVAGVLAVFVGLLFGQPNRADELLAVQKMLAPAPAPKPVEYIVYNTAPSVAAAPATNTTPTTQVSSTAPAPEAMTITPVSNEEIAKQTIANIQATLSQVPQQTATNNYEQARWNPIHFKPAIDKATDAQCLACHQEVLTTNTRDTTPAGLNKNQTIAWYQTLDTYQGEQMTFHQRHLVAPFIKKVATMSCTTCHQGNDPREETGTGSADAQANLTLRKMVNPQVCLMCHGQFPYKNMGLTGPWHESGQMFQNNCLLCHAAIRTTRHQVNFLKAADIEKEGAANSDTCYGCHGGRSWYRTSFPYPRHPWPGSSPAPDWAKDRPTESDLRFLIQGAPAQQ